MLSENWNNLMDNKGLQQNGARKAAERWAAERGRIQHQLPIGRFKVPEKQRFRFEPELFHAVSIDPEIEVVDTNYGGHTEGRWLTILLRIQGKLYAFNGYQEVEFDRHGKQVAFGEGRSRTCHSVWERVTTRERFYGVNSDRASVDNDIIPYQIRDIDDPVMKIAMEYFAIDKTFERRLGVKRIVIDEKQPIEIKNWEVIRHD